jgi:hypothetical protein
LLVIACQGAEALHSLSPVAKLVIACQGAGTLPVAVAIAVAVAVAVPTMSDKNMLKLNNENYEIWKILMEAILVRKQLREVAIGLLQRPAGLPNAVWAWDWKNQEARAELQLAVEWDQLLHMTAHDASEIWTELERVHRLTGFTMRMGLKRKLWKMEMKDGQRIASWIADVKGVVFQLSQIGVVIPDEDIILALTNGLPSSYEQLVLTLDSTPSEVFNLDYVIGRLRTEEARQHPESRGSATDHVLSITCDRPKRSLADITCFKCGNKGHYQANCPTNPAPPCAPPYKPENKPVSAAAVTASTDDEGAGFW